MILAWMRLIRISNLPSVASNILVGYLLAAWSWDWSFSSGVVWAIVAGSCFYSAGIIGNDLHDFDDDLKRRPERPLPTGTISRRAAWIGMFALFAVGLVICHRYESISFNARSELRGGGGISLGPLSILAATLVVAIIIYDFLLKRFWFSAIFMGICRGLNLLLGATFALVSMEMNPGYLHSPWVWGAAISMTIYVAGLTMLARDESADRPRRWLMALGVGSMAIGLCGNAWLESLIQPNNINLSENLTRSHLILICVIGFTVIRSGIMACISPDATRIRGAVKTALLSLITIDAANALLATGGQAGYSVAILALLFAGIALSRFINPT